jgi:hypothetical protein
MPLYLSQLRRLFIKTRENTRSGNATPRVNLSLAQNQIRALRVAMPLDVAKCHPRFYMCKPTAEPARTTDSVKRGYSGGILVLFIAGNISRLYIL